MSARGTASRHRARLDAVEDLLAQRLMHGAEHEVVGLGDAHLLGCLAEVRLVAWDRAVVAELPEHPIRPRAERRLGLDQLRRPPSPEHRATAQAIGEPGEADWARSTATGAPTPRPGPPRGRSSTGGEGPGRGRAGSGRARGGRRARRRGPGCGGAEAIAAEAVLGERRAEGATADDDDVERPTIDAGGAGDRLVEPVADVAAEHVLGEVRVLGDGAGHARPPALAVVDSSIFTPRIDRSPRCARSMTSGTVTAGR